MDSATAILTLTYEDIRARKKNIVHLQWSYVFLAFTH